MVSEGDLLLPKRALRSKQRTYPELFGPSDARCVVFAVEVGGRWSPFAIDLVHALAGVKAESAPRLIRKSAQIAWFRRWTAMMAVAAQSALAASLVEPSLAFLSGVNGPDPSLSALFEAEVYADAPATSRLPLRG